MFGLDSHKHEQTERISFSSRLTRPRSVLGMSYESLARQRLVHCSLQFLCSVADTAIGSWAQHISYTLCSTCYVLYQSICSYTFYVVCLCMCINSGKVVYIRMCSYILQYLLSSVFVRVEIGIRMVMFFLCVSEWTVISRVIYEMFWLWIINRRNVFRTCMILYKQFSYCNGIFWIQWPQYLPFAFRSFIQCLIPMIFFL